MPQFPAWKLTTAAWTDAAESRTSQIRDALSDFATRGRTATDDLGTRAAAIAAQTRDRCEAIPRAIVDEIRRRVNLLDLATKQDVEAQTRLARNRVSYVLKEFLEEQRDHEQQMFETLRSDLREELETFVAAIGDDLFAPDRTAAVPARDGVREFLEEDDELDLLTYEGVGPLDDEFDISDDGTMVRGSLLDAADG